MEPNASPPLSDDGPDWVRESLRVAADELRRFVATALAFTLRPARFSAAWLAGETTALNPLGFVATAIAVSGAAAALLAGGGNAGGGGLWDLLTGAVAPYAYYIALGALCHPIMRWFGSRRRLRASVAVALFAGGGPGLVLLLACYACEAARQLLFGLHTGSLLRGLPLWAQLVFLVVFGGAALLFIITLARGQRGVHGARSGHAAVALTFSLVASALVLGALHRRVEFALGVPHFTIMWFGWVPIPDLWF